MNEERLTQSAIEAERKALDAVFSILLIVVALLTAFSLGYFIAMNEAAALVKTI